MTYAIKPLACDPKRISRTRRTVFYTVSRAARTLDLSYAAVDVSGLRPRRFAAGAGTTSAEMVAGWLGLRPRRFATAGASDTGGLGSAWRGGRPRPSSFAKAERRAE